jgi:Flp pilus assembly protein TadD
LAVEHARRAAELAPELPGVHETLAEALFQAGDRAGAVAAIQRAIDLDPTNRAWLLQKQRIDAGDPSAPLPEGR